MLFQKSGIFWKSGKSAITLKTLKNLFFSDVFSGYKRGQLAYQKTSFFLVFSRDIVSDNCYEMGYKNSLFYGTSIVATTTFSTQTFPRDFFPKFKDTFLHDWLRIINSNRSWSSFTYLIYQVASLLVLCTDLWLLSLVYLPKNTRNFILAKSICQRSAVSDSKICKQVHWYQANNRT